MGCLLCSWNSCGSISKDSIRCLTGLWRSHVPSKERTWRTGWLWPRTRASQPRRRPWSIWRQSIRSSIGGLCPSSQLATWRSARWLSMTSCSETTPPRTGCTRSASACWVWFFSLGFYTSLALFLVWVWFRFWFAVVSCVILILMPFLVGFRFWFNFEFEGDWRRGWDDCHGHGGWRRVHSFSAWGPPGVDPGDLARLLSRSFGCCGD